jgi:hypothetical protein
MAMRAPVVAVLAPGTDQAAKADMAMAARDWAVLDIMQVMGRKLFEAVRPSRAVRIPNMPVLNFQVLSIPFAVQ